MKTISFKFLFLLLFSICISHSNGQTKIFVDNQFKEKTIGKHLLFIDDANLLFNPESAFQALKKGIDTFTVHKEIPQFGFQNSTKWALFTIQNTTTKVKKLVIEISYPSINILHLYSLNKKDSSLQFIGISGDTIPFKDRTWQHRYPLFEIQVEPNKSIDYMLHFYKNGAVSLPITLYESSHFFKVDGLTNLVFGIYCGSIILLIVVSLFMGILNKKLIYLLYGLYTASLLFQVLISEGYGFMLFYPDATSFSSIARGVCAIVVLLFYILFTQSFLNLQHSLPKYNAFLGIFALILTVISCSTILLINWHSSALYIAIYTMYSLIVIIFIATIIAGILSLKYNRIIAILYLIGYGFVIMGSLLFLLRKIGWIPHIFITRYGLVLGSVLEILTLGIGLALWTRKTLQDKYILEKSLLEKENELNKALLVGENNERQRIAQDLHDGIGVQLRILKQQLKNENDEKLVDKIAEEIRTISHNLMPSNIEHLGLVNLVQDVAHNLSASNQIEIQVVSIDCPFLNDKNLGLSLFRIIQECLQNAIKHSHANKIIVQLIGHHNELSITIEDDGKGMNDATTFGLGLNNIKSRIEKLEGTCTLESDEKLGTLICLTIPINI
jgi:signal transduction histidine kinase